MKMKKALILLICLTALSGCKNNTADVSETTAEQIAAVSETVSNTEIDTVTSTETDAYRKWVLENTEESEKYERQKFTHQLDVKEDGSFTHYTCTFADHPLEDTYSYCERGDIVLKFCT